MAEVAVRKGKRSIRLVCEALGMSETCYRYQAKNDRENGFIADWLLRLKWSGKSNSFFVFDKWTLLFIMLHPLERFFQSTFLSGSCNREIGVL